MADDRNMRIAQLEAEVRRLFERDAALVADGIRPIAHAARNVPIGRECV
jgi:hypothetical protein